MDTELHMSLKVDLYIYKQMEQLLFQFDGPRLKLDECLKMFMTRHVSWKGIIEDYRHLSEELCQCQATHKSKYLSSLEGQPYLQHFWEDELVCYHASSTFKALTI